MHVVDESQRQTLVNLSASKNDAATRNAPPKTAIKYKGRGAMRFRDLDAAFT